MESIQLLQDAAA